jgi:ATP-binding cassette subfamily A (ABC1) protein 3
MEEAEALSTKLGIMVSGKLVCFGSAQHIKNKFGEGYEVEIKIKTLSEEDKRF